MKVERIPLSLVTKRPACEAFVHVAEHTNTAARRRFRAEKAGRSPNQCAAPAYWRINGKPMCLNHAGQNALDYLEGRKL